MKCPAASGYTLIEATDGAESVYKAGSERPELVLMDIQLPVLDGYDGTRQIKALPSCAAIPRLQILERARALIEDEGHWCPGDLAREHHAHRAGHIRR